MAKQPSIGTAIILVLALALLALTIPAIQTSTASTISKSHTQAVNETYRPTAKLSFTLTKLNQSNGQATIVAVNDADDSSSTVVINSTKWKTFNYASGHVTVSNTGTLTNDGVLLKYQYPTYFGYPSGSPTVTKAIPLILLVIFIFLIYQMVGGISS